MIAPGTRLGPYEVSAQIGEGGMGVVYRATDSRLGREVAVKILPETFAHDPERMARFEREAKTLASLNHPNIAQVYGFEKWNDTYALVMELVGDQCVVRERSSGPAAASSSIAAKWVTACLPFRSPRHRRCVLEIRRSCSADGSPSTPGRVRGQFTTSRATVAAS